MRKNIVEEFLLRAYLKRAYAAQQFITLTIVYYEKFTFYYL